MGLDPYTLIKKNFMKKCKRLIVFYSFAVISNMAIAQTAVREDRGNKTPQEFATNSIFPQPSRSSEGTFYAVDLRNDDFGTMPQEGPYNITPIDNTYGFFILAGQFAPDGRLLALDDGNPQQFVEVDINTGEFNVLGPLTNLISGHTTAGLSYNPVDDKWYALSTTGTQTTLYEIAPDGTLTVIGNTGTPAGIWLVIDNDGLAFMADIATDSFYSINLSTGVATFINAFGGGTGFNLQFGQDADVDRATNTIYMAAYFGQGVGRIYTVDQTTGDATFQGVVNSNDGQVGLFAIDSKELSINDQLLINSIQLYPNPVNNILNINKPDSIEIQALELIDVFGRATDIAMDGESISISGLAAGFYILNIKTNTGTIIKKIVKE